jgi:1-acyl-sn-glycerol-3-phosphate acyltransferase
MFYLLLRGIIWVLLKILFWMLGGVRVSGRENIPRRGGVIIAPNHRSHSDPPLVGVTLPRYAWFLATDELFTIRFWGTLGRWMRGYPIRQDSPDRAALRRTEELLKSGEAVVIFPEGHESVTAELQPLQGGPILIAMRTGVPILPVALAGTERIMPARTFRLRRTSRPLAVRYGKPIPIEELTGGFRGREAVEHGVQRLTAALQQLIREAEEQVGEPARKYSSESAKAKEGIAD